MKDRALFILPDAGDRLTTRQVEQQAAGLRQANYLTHVCALRSNASAMTAEHCIRRWRPWDAAAAWRLRQLVRQFRPHVVHVAPGDADRFVVVALAGAWDGQLVLHQATRLPRWAQLGRTSPVHQLTTTAAQRQALVELGADPACLHHVTPSLDGERGSGVSRNVVTSQLGIPAAAKLLGISADFVPVQRLRDVIWMGDLLKVVRDDTHLLIFGDGPERLRLERFRQCVEIEDRVHFLRPPADLWAWLAQLDCYVSAAGGDSVDAAMIHMMRVGVPLVVSDTAGHRELLQNESSGLLFPVGNRAHFARHALRVLEEPGLKQRLTAAAQLSWQRRWRPAMALEQFVALHEELGTSTRLDRDVARDVREMSPSRVASRSA